MAGTKPKTFMTGAGIVWRRQRVLWWIFIVSLFFSFLGTRHPVGKVGEALNHSLGATPRLFHGFDVSAIAELGEQPEAPLELFNQSFLIFPLLYAIFMLFAAGGILESYYRDATLTTGEFFGASGRHFWRFFRLLIYFAIASIPIMILYAIAGGIYDRLDEVSTSPLTAVYFFGAATVVILFFAMSLRLWFDMAQVIAVADEETRMHKALRLAAGLVWHNFGSLFWLYFRISFVGCLGFGLGLYWWMMRLRPESTTAAFYLAQIMILFWIATRLWQRASEAAWYREHQASAAEPVPAFSPVPVPVMAASAAATQAME
jgi:hypothetical protein